MLHQSSKQFDPDTDCISKLYSTELKEIFTGCGLNLKTLLLSMCCASFCNKKSITCLQSNAFNLQKTWGNENKAHKSIQTTIPNMVSSKFTYTYFLLTKAKTLFKFQSDQYKEVLCKEPLLTESLCFSLWPNINI